MGLAKIVLASILALSCGGNTKSETDGSLDARVDANHDTSVTDPGLCKGPPYISNENNIPPVAILLPECDEYSSGECMYRMKPWETRCWQLSESYDPDGYLVKFYFDLYQHGVYYCGEPVDEMCGGYTSPGEYQAFFTIYDNNGASDTITFRGIAGE